MQRAKGGTGHFNPLITVMENLHCLWGVSGRTPLLRTKRVILLYAEMKQCPAADDFFLSKRKCCRMGIKLVLHWKRTMKTSLQVPWGKAASVTSPNLGLPHHLHPLKPGSSRTGPDMPPQSPSHWSLDPGLVQAASRKTGPGPSPEAGGPVG